MTDKTKEERLKSFYEEMLLSASTPEKLTETKIKHIYPPRKNVQTLVRSKRRK